MGVGVVVFLVAVNSKPITAWWNTTVLVVIVYGVGGICSSGRKIRLVIIEGNIGYVLQPFVLPFVHQHNFFFNKTMPGVKWRDE